MPPLQVLLCLALSTIRFITCLEVGSVARGFRFDVPGGTADDFVPFLTSKNGAFAAGFLRTNSAALTLAVVGIGEQVRRPLDTIWIANRDSPVHGSAGVLFDSNLSIVKAPGDAVLLQVFSTPTAQALELTDSGNLVSRSSDRLPLWQSFQHPTDTLLEGQNFTRGMKLVSWASTADSSSGHYSMELGPDRMVLYAKFGPGGGEPYWDLPALGEPAQLDPSKGPMYMRIGNGFLTMYQSETQRVHYLPFGSLNSNSVPNSTLRRARVDTDGNFRVYYWQNGVKVEDYVAVDSTEPCKLPLACGEYGVCKVSRGEKSCSCPASASETARNSSFSFRASSEPSQGCVPRNPPQLCASASSSQLQGFDDEFLELRGVDYFANVYTAPINSSLSLEQCRDGCLKQCSCKAFFFRDDSHTCFHTDQLLSLLASANQKNGAYVRLRNPLELSHAGSSSSAKRKPLAITVLVLAILCGMVSAAFGLYYLRRRRKLHRGRTSASDEESFLGSSNRFSYSELESADDRNSKVVIIKLSSPLKHSKHEFESRVQLLETLGRQHPNIGKLRGYCIHSDDYLLVYERLANGTLADHLEQEQDWGHELLDWNTKLRIGLGIARGLAFLHSKGISVGGGLAAGNVVLDEEFVAKLCCYVEEDKREFAGDVSSLGRILLELVGGDKDDERGDAYWVNRKRMLDAATRCCSSDVDARPTAETVVDILEGRFHAFNLES